MKKLIFLTLLYLVSACSLNKYVQPQSFMVDKKDIEKAAVILNNYAGKNLYYLINEFDNKDVGDFRFGSSRIHEIYADEGQHLMNISTSFYLDLKSLYDSKRVHRYEGTIQCQFEKGKYYTIELSESGQYMKLLRPNYHYAKSSLELSLGDKVINLYGQPKLACIEHAEKPENTELSKEVIENGLRINNQFY